MPAEKFTDQFVKNAQPEAKLVDYSATNCQALHLRVTPNGVKTFTMVYRSKITGKPVNLTLGRYPDVSLAVAQEWVNAARARNANSQPVGEFTLAKKNEPSVADILALYNERHLSTIRSQREVFTALTSIVRENRWGDFPFTTLDKETIMDALYVIRNRAPRYAGNLQQMISTWMKWSVVHNKRQFNPIAGMPNIGGKAKRRERVLTDAEIRALWTACHNPRAYALRTVYADTMLTILTTACRPGMACGLTKDELFGFARQPAAERRNVGALADFAEERMKKGRAFVLPLNSLALDVIKRRLDTVTGSILFPTPSKEPKDKGKQVRVRRLSAITKELSVTLGFKTHFTPHDLRRTASKLLRRAE